MLRKYFAASNSAHGFKSYFPDVFSSVDYLFVIKGGPGTGKSSFMKKCARAVTEKGYELEYYYCSSDADSLDGILWRDGERAVGMLDGTPPHVWELKHPGAVEEIINLGNFWDRRLLSAQKNEIVALSNKKTSAYNKAYHYLRSCGNLRAVTDMLLRDSIDAKKMRAAAERLVKEYSDLKKEETTSFMPAIADAVTMKGSIRFNTFEQNAKNLYRISYSYGTGQLFLNELKSCLENKKISARIAYDAICPWLINGIFIENDNRAFVVAQADSDSESGDGRDSANSDKHINTKRFIHSDELRAARTELRYAEKLSDNALEGALHALSEVNVYHFLLEDIYKNAMDFTALTDFTESFIHTAI